MSDDQLAIDKIATLLGTHEEWDEPSDYLEDIANIIGTVRPHPGKNQTHIEYAEAFRKATGREVIDDYYGGEDDDEDGDAPTHCAHCGKEIEADDGGAIWYHVETMEGFCDPEGQHRIDRTAEPSTKED